MRIIIIGAGGHGQVVADILWQMQAAGLNIEPTAYLDDDGMLHGQEISGLPVLGGVNDLSLFAHDGLVVAIGHNDTRQRVVQRLQVSAENFVTAVHPAAIIAPGVRIGPGTMVCANVVINTGAVIGSHVILNTACTVDHHNQIDNFAHIAPGVHLGGDVQVREGSLIGISAAVLPQKQIGAWCTIGAGAVVHCDIPDGATAVGIPARIIKNRQNDN